MSTAVNAFLRVVANGVAPQHGSGSTRLSATLIVTPELLLDGADTAQAIDLARWPSQFAGRIQRGASPASGRFEVALHLQRVGAPGEPVLGAEYRVKAVAVGHARVDPKDWAGATAAWSEALTRELRHPWAALAKDIASSLEGRKHKAEPTSRYDAPDEAPQQAFDADGAILTPEARASDTMVVKGIVPVRQGRFAVDEERVRAARVLAKTTLGPHVFEDEPPVDIGRTRKGEIADFDEARRTELYRQFREATLRTNDDRGETHATFGAIHDIVTGAGGAAAQAFGARGDRALVPKAEGVRSGQERAEERATHAYGTWLQRRPGLTFKPRADERGRPIDPSGVVDTDAAEDRVRGLFYAFQGDPFLSRLFCLAVDLEFALPSELEGVAGPIYLRISAEAGEASRRRTPRVATVAKLEADGFWPASIFEAGVITKEGVDTLIREPTLVEQSGGFWLMDHGYAPETPTAHAPRYDLTALDIRRAVDAKPDAVDRGERHLTAGFTMLDNGRGEQVARDLALAALNSAQIAGAAAGAERALVVLYAEQLTIGRRVDVASAAPGAAVETLDWRSLMYRYVRYVGLDRAPERLLSTLLRGREPDGRYLDEGAFQVAARLMPMVHAADGGERQVEAVPEEAVFSWDGTPAGALTEAGAGAERAGQEIPFVRRMEPPSMTGSGRALCPAPLRFGAPYLFRWRSFFLGGGAPPLKTARAGEEAGRTMLPPAVDGKAAPRRFLRHEGIAPPVLLLPRHLATLDYGPMGFEQADQAIVRSAVPADPFAGGSGTTSPGPAYVPLAQRSQPGETMRVFVVPEVAREIVERHGRLDDAATAGAVQRGGLLDVTFDPADHSRTAEKATGFPTVLTRSAQAFGPDPVPYARVLHRADGDRIGIPVFEPGGRNATPAGGIGYLPDPAAEEYCVRLRVQRSGRYLAGCVTVQVYDAGAGIAYPHALPLVVTVRREARDRPHPATGIDEVVEGGAALDWMVPTGRISPARPRDGRGTRVRHVVVKLCRGEDFALEVTCVPKPPLLAGTFSLPETIAMQLAEARIDPAVRERLEALTGPLPEKRLVGGDTGSGLTGLAGRPVPGGGAVGKAARDILDAAAKTSPVEELAAVTIVRVCHAVNAPPETSADILSGLRGRRPTIPKTDGWERNPVPDDVPGAEGMLITGTLRIDLERVDAFELVATSAAAGPRPLDDISRSRSLVARRAGRWPKLTTVNGERRYIAPRLVVGFDVDEAGRVTLPAETVRLLRVDNLPARAEADSGDGLFGARVGRLTEVSLGRLYAAAMAERPIPLPVDGDAILPKDAKREARNHVVKAAQYHRIADTRARKLLLKVTTLSRSAEAFETAPRYGDGDRALHRRQPLRPSDQARSSREFELWVPSTKRPPACAMRRPEVAPVITREAVNGKDGIVQRVCRRVLTRLYIKRGWNASGEGERLGIVLWPPNYFEQTEKDVDGNIVTLNGRTVSIALLQDGDLGPGGAFVTRWGGDPTRRDACPQDGVLVPPSAFEDATDGCASPHRPRIVQRARMPIRPASPSDDDATSDFMDVTLLTFEPCFDLDREEWYVDVDLKPNRATDPFVRFGLVRYQEHAISPDLQVSYPVVCHTQVMPRRDLTLERRKGEHGNSVLHVTVRGHGATGIQPLDLERILRGNPQLPDLRASFGKLARPEVRVTVFHETGEDGDVPLRTPLSPSESWAVARSELNVATLEWEVDVPLPAARMKELGAGRFVAYVEEVDRRMAASYASEPVAPAEIFREATYREQGPRFSARVPFLDTK